MYEVMIENKRDNAYNVTAGNDKYTIDPTVKGGGPLDTFLAALGSCIGVYANKYLDGAKLPVKAFKINIKSDLHMEKPVRFKDIFVTIEFDGEIEESRREAVLRFIKNCPVHNTIEGSPNIEVKIK